MYRTCLAGSPPSAPRNVRVEWKTETTVSLLWNPPRYGGPILCYKVEKRQLSSEDDWHKVVDDCTTTNYLVTGLIVGTCYLLRVAARNYIGPGPFEQLPSPVTTSLQYGELSTSTYK